MAPRISNRSTGKPTPPVLHDVADMPARAPDGATSWPEVTLHGEPQPLQDREARIAQAAYRRAEQRGFAPGLELEDWLAAEREVDASMGAADALGGFQGS